MMAAEATNTRTTAQFEYKESYDDSGGLGYSDYSKTVGYVKETATNTQIFDGVTALFSITIYHNAPYKVYRTDKSQLIVE